MASGTFQPVVAYSDLPLLQQQSLEPLQRDYRQGFYSNQTKRLEVLLYQQDLYHCFYLLHLVKQMEIQERQTAIAEIKAQTDAQMAEAKIRLDAEKAAASHALQSDNMDLKEAQFAHKRNIDEAELEVLKKTDDVRGIASPTG